MFFKDKEEQIYHKFCVINAGSLPDKFFRSLWRSNFDNTRNCWLWISKEESQKASLDWEIKKDYCFLMKLGEHKTAAFNIKDFRSLSPDNSNNMVLKTKDYWENTVQKIGFWGSENYFYEAGNPSNPPKKLPQNSPHQTTQKEVWIKVILICLPFLIFTLLIVLLIKWMSKRKK